MRQRHFSQERAQAEAQFATLFNQEQIEREHQQQLANEYEFSKSLREKRKKLYGKRKSKVASLHGQVEQFKFKCEYNGRQVFVCENTGKVRAAKGSDIQEFPNLDSLYADA